MREIGIDKFSIFLIEEVKCNNRDELDKIEEQYRIKLNATLNKNKAYCELKGNDYAKKYIQENKEKLEKKSICKQCGGKFTHANKSIHEKTKKHKNAIKQKEINNFDIDKEFNEILKHNNELQLELPKVARLN
jgi:formate dehydrogenase assembly factor FdhD